MVDMLILSGLSVEWSAERGVDQFIATSGSPPLTGTWTNQNGGSQGGGGATCRAVLRGISFLYNLKFNTNSLTHVISHTNVLVHLKDSKEKVKTF